ncbi:MAG TPA: hypothetical protein VG713_14715 [Pirellulales bacterium]|nr:hypothetical protein [Pirellulales bacterium]
MPARPGFQQRIVIFVAAVSGCALMLAVAWAGAPGKPVAAAVEPSRALSARGAVRGTGEARGNAAPPREPGHSFLHYFDSRNEHLAAQAIAIADARQEPGSNAERWIDTIDDHPSQPIVPTSGSTGLPPEAERLKRKVRQVIAMYRPKRLNNRDNNAWEVMHSIIGYGVRSELLRSSSTGAPVNSVSWLCANGPCKGDRMLYLDRGRVSARQGVGVQGHYGQFLAILAQSYVPIDYPLYVDSQKFAIEDLVKTEQLGCRAGTELTFKLIALAHYLPDDEPWTNREGETWTIDRLVREEIKAPIRGAACGGTHRLMGLAYAVRRREDRDQPIEGEYLRAKKYLADYHRYTFGLQNADGSFSTEWFAKRGNRDDLDRKLQTTGHILEWLVYSLSAEELADRRVTRAVDYLSSILMKSPGRDWEIGPLGHAIHALSLYDRRRQPPNETTPAAQAPELASRAKRPATGEPRPLVPSSKSAATSKSAEATAPQPKPVGSSATRLKPAAAIVPGAKVLETSPALEPTPSLGKRGAVQPAESAKPGEIQPSNSAGDPGLRLLPAGNDDGVP